METARKLLTVEKFLCCYALKKGAWIAAVYTTVWAAVGAAGAFLAALPGESAVNWAIFVFSLVCLLASTLLCFAIKKENACFLLIGTSLHTFLWLVAIVLFLVITLSVMELGPLLFGLPMYVIDAYLLLILWSYAIELKFKTPTTIEEAQEP